MNRSAPRTSLTMPRSKLDDACDAICRPADRTTPAADWRRALLCFAEAQRRGAASARAVRAGEVVSAHGAESDSKRPLDLFYRPNAERGRTRLLETTPAPTAALRRFKPAGWLLAASRLQATTPVRAAQGNDARNHKDH
jgi:hypothetical protein